MLSYQYMKSHCGDKTIFQMSYLQNPVMHQIYLISVATFAPLKLKIIV